MSLMCFRFACSHDVFRCNQLCMEWVLFGNTVDHFRRSWIYYSFSTIFKKMIFIANYVVSSKPYTVKIPKIVILNVAFKCINFCKTNFPFVFADEQTGKTMLHTMLVFITGCQTLQSVEKIYVVFNSDQKKLYLESDSCFNRVHLPLCHNTYQEFHNACLTSLEFGGKGYGRF